MLSAIRQKLRFWGLMILLILVGIPLVFMGLGNYQTPQKDYSAIINDQVVSQARLEQEIFQYKQALKRNYQGNIPPIYTDKFIKKITLDYMTRSILLDDMALKLGLKFHNRSIINEIRNTSAFKNEKGFTPEVYRKQLSQIGMRPEEYERYIHQKGIREQLESAITNTSFLTQQEKNDLIKFRYHTREGDYILIPYDQIKETVVISDGELEKYYEKNKNDFMKPKKAIFSFIDVNKFDLISAVKTNEQILSDIYTEKLANGEYFKPSLYKINHILISNQDTSSSSHLKDIASQTHKRLNEGMSFPDAAKLFSNDEETKTNKGYLGEFFLNDLPRFLQVELKNMKIGEISKIIKSDKGFHIVSIQDKTSETQLSFDNVKRDIDNEYRTEEGTRLFFNLTDQISEENFKDNTNIKNIADMLNLKIQTSKVISTDEGYGIFNYEHVRKPLFDKNIINNHSNSNLIYINENRFIIARLKDYFTPEKFTFGEAKNIIMALLVTQKTNKKSLIEANSVLKKAKDHGKIIGYKKINYNLSLEADHIDNEIKQILFSTNIRKEYQLAKMNNGNYLVYRINSINYPKNVEKFSSQNNKYSNFIINTRSESEYSNFYDTIKNDADIKINEDYFDLD